MPKQDDFNVCFICSETYNTMIPLQQVLQDCGALTVAEILEYLQLLPISDTINSCRTVCFICTARLQSSFKLKRLCTQIESTGCEKSSIDPETFSGKQDISSKNLAARSSSKKIYTCDICNKAFTYASSIAAHKLIHTGKRPFKCDICDKSFSNSSNLTKHKLIHTGERPFKCDICNKSFTYSSNLTKHKLIHTGEKPFKCDICDKSFTQLGNLTIHKFNHTGGKPFKCDFCDKSFARLKHLTAHQKSHIGRKPLSLHV